MQENESTLIPRSSHSAARLALALALLLVLSVSIWNSARAGLSSLLYTYAQKSGQLAPADAAVTLRPGDPDAHFVRGAVLEASGDLPAAIEEYKQAAALRPEDFALWLSLARAHELSGDVPNAIAAARQAVPLAPFYAQPHWQLGNILVRAGQKEEGFSELRLAAASNPTMLPGIIDLAWGLSAGDIQFVKQAIQPQSPEAFLALAEYLKKRGAVSEAIAMFRSAGSEGVEQRQHYVGELLTSGRFKDAYELWLIDHPAITGDPISRINDPGFELESNLDEQGFGWRATGRVPTLALALDPDSPRAGRYSLRVEFKGESDPALPVISQVVLVEPHTHYQLHFAVRTEAIVSGGLPRVVIVDAGAKSILGGTPGLPAPTSAWQEYVVDFDSLNATAIQINLQRENCSSSPCPIFGHLWLDDFSLRKL